jgi:hypothetical protein
MVAITSVAKGSVDQNTDTPTETVVRAAWRAVGLKFTEEGERGRDGRGGDEVGERCSERA